MAGIVVVSNYVVGIEKNYSGIIDYYERYVEKNGSNFLNADDLTRIETAIENENILLSKNEKRMLNSYDEYLKNGGQKDLMSFIKDNDQQNEIVYGNYINYMNKSIKSSGLFGDESNHFSLEEKIAMKDAFNKGQDNGSVLWGNVYSFDNEFLEKYNLYDSKTGYLNEIRIKEAVRSSVRTMINEEKLDTSAVWCGEIHYDTDNIHVHTSIVEMENTRPIVEVEKKRKISSKYYESTGEMELQPKAKLKKETLDKMKSVFANKLIDRTKDLKAISDLRMSLHHSIQIDEKLRKQKDLLKNIRDSLPTEKKDWQYNNKKMENLKPFIDKYNENYLNTYHKEDYDQYKSLLKKEEEFYKEIYGEGDKNRDRYKDYSKNKLDELKSRMGNELLRELKNESQNSQKEISYRKGDKGNEFNSKKMNPSRMKMIDRKEYYQKYDSKNFKSISTYRPAPMIKVNQAIRKTLRSEKRNRELDFEHQQLQNKIDQERNRQEYQSEYGL